ncbi:acetyl-CoA C-acetyltransferase [Gordonia terrae]|uniref:Acetyl-CoA C-acetyltransferase n=2 Tax=Gordonia terrae TaxID=2055 RepID=A0AAD0K881_9ACTN|nr:acetyl-CoA C-acetyltransferase [Gordonia terrae]VTR10794.1 acetyl-CoA acetyltransferase [Clostridioides difficile]ANY24367.1 acetyl-CoA acetyltransferase [Gordonia terrae]AWO85113.1 acetyl-CoA C-acetyltransferase [Gordonia terrae]VTS58623.1 Putative acyltransferase Rv0859 [Gordonia terrae]GAB46740.1 acetyl-CoA acyltransferase [Gordonia terrae NBRC 100016]
MPEAFIYDAIRTPRGKGRATGALNSVKPVTLAAEVLKQITLRNPCLDPAEIVDVVMGNATPVGEHGADLPKAAAMSAGLPDHVTGMQINRFCASGLEAVNIAAQKVRSGWEDFVIAGGVESMSRVQMGSDGGPMMSDPATILDNRLEPQGISADLLASLEGFTRDEIDAYSVRSHQRAAQAWAEGRFERSVVPVIDENGVVLLDHDQAIRPDVTTEAIGSLAPSFATYGSYGFDAMALARYHWLERVDHVHSAGSSSGIVDGASAVLVGTEDAGRRFGLTPRARIASAALSGVDGTLMLTGPTAATLKLFDRTGLTVDDIDLFELNEAFAAVVLKYQRDLAIPDEKINVNGGAIAMGHPLGATGAMIAGAALDELERTERRRAIVTLCAGGGMGIATLIERV